jgi:hypothetical protein
MDGQGGHVQERDDDRLRFGIITNKENPCDWVYLSRNGDMLTRSSVGTMSLSKLLSKKASSSPRSRFTRSNMGNCIIDMLDSNVNRVVEACICDLGRAITL